MEPPKADRNLLFGVLALQLDLVDRDALISAMNAWVTQKQRPLGDILVERGALDPVDRDMLQPMVDRHIARHDHDPRKSLTVLEAQSTLGAILSEIKDSELEATLTFLGTSKTEPTLVREPAKPPVGQRTATGGRFRLLRLHDRGGLGEVYVARDEEVYREVALKQIRAEKADDEQSRARFLLEAEITGGLEHPGIVPVYGLGHHSDGRPFYAMRFIRGNSLKEAIATFHDDERLRRDVGWRGLELRKLLDRFLDVCDAIAYAHSRGVLHRDLKPGNVMLGNYGETLVVDWGLAKAIGKSEVAPDEEAALVPASGSAVEATRMGQRLGTPAYMPPEQAAGRLEDLGPRSDVYSLGATLYALLTGRAPFADGDLLLLLDSVEKGRFKPPRQVQPWIDPALDAICRKAMAREPLARYESPRGLAEDLQKWLADEPVSAWREPPAKRLSRWSRKHRTLVTSAAVALLVAFIAVGYAAYRARLGEIRRLLVANGRVDALATAEVRSIPLILEQLGGDRSLVRDRLKAIARGDGSGADDLARLPASLALVPDDPLQAHFLAGRALKPESSPDEVLVIREALASLGEAAEMGGTFRRELASKPDRLDDVQLRAAGMLARLAPRDPIWPGLAGPLAGKLALENSLRIAAWRQVFQPISPHLVGPLRKLYADRSRPDPRERAFTLLLEFANQGDNPGRPEDLAELLLEADTGRQDQILSRLASPADRARAVGILSPWALEVVKHDESRTGRQARAAAALLRLGREQSAWPLFARVEDPGVRTELIHELPGSGIAPNVIAGRSKAERDVAARRALLLCLGEFPPGSIPEADRAALASELLNQYQNDPDPGIHGALNWVLKVRWGLAGRVDAIDREVVTADPPVDRDWFENGQGQAFSIVRGPVEFLMGSTPETDPDRQADEVPHRRRIPRSFAIGAREVTVAEYGRFLDTKPSGIKDVRQDPLFRQYIPTPDCAQGNVTWFEVARYCNWLSAQEGLPESEWCYPKEIASALKLDDDGFRKAGYRLPTEAEWEYACRSGSLASRPFGRSEQRLESYAWFGNNAGKSMHPVGLKKPNDLGLFDMLGNAAEWCGDPQRPYPPPAEQGPAVDTIGPVEVGDSTLLPARGGTFFFPPALVRSAWRMPESPTNRAIVLGFRLARTISRGHPPGD